jgi:hypothetical protein
LESKEVTIVTTHLNWSSVERALDEVEQDDKAGIVAVFLEFEGRSLEEWDMRGARRTVNVSTFCQHFHLGRQTFARWLRDHTNEKETA